ncbi:PREDICTED: RNA-binding protein 39-like isoform X1 [Lupinus angustifolius]|uniref:RNA-binding protein 39-like isoform X1 n=1 Tax=Lupinus angustifolius TaxID=3871 RepID=UPI00092FB072|nr:PREDICTED: RNA-binding protein 39-like isoform X1 [Lupinus angustifolius]
MDFDEYEYLEKTVEDHNDKVPSKKKDSDRSSRKRDVDDVLDAADDRRRSRRSRGDDENGSSREKERDKDRISTEREKGRDKDRDRERRDQRKREKERERYRRSRSRSERDTREVDFESRDARRGFRDKKEAVEPEADPERDQRTVFAYQMPLKATERDVYEFFSKAGKVRDVRLIMDRHSKRSKGVGYIEFYDAMSVPMAIALSGQLLFGQPVMVKPSEAEKNLVQSNASSGAAGVAGPYGAVDRKLYVGNLHFNMTESLLREIFEPFGPVEVVQLPLDLETGHCKGFGFIQFAQLEHAKAAQSLNGKLEIAGRIVKVSSVTDHLGNQDTTAKSTDLDDDEGGMVLNAQSRVELMRKLAGDAVSAGVPMVNGSAPAAISLPIGNPGVVSTAAFPSQFIPTPVAETVGIPSECLLLKNMFDPSTETEPDFDLDIKEDVEEECSKYGRVKHIYVHKRSAGFVYLRFETVKASSDAQHALHMRWFARKLISAIFVQPHEYEAKFKGEC